MLFIFTALPIKRKEYFQVNKDRLKERNADHYYFKQPEPLQSCLLALKEIIMAHNADITHGRLFQLPFFWYKGYKLAFLWVHRKKLLLGFVEDLQLQKARPGLRRKNRYETMEIDPGSDIPVKKITAKLQKLMEKYDRVVPLKE